MMTHFRNLLLILAILLLAACGGDDGGSQDPIAPVTPTPPANPAERALLAWPDARCIAYSPDGAPGGAQIAIARGAAIWLYTADLAPIRALTGHTDTVRALAWSPDGSRLASAALDNTARVWDPADGSTLATLTGHSNWVVAVVWSPDGSQIATGSTDDTVRTWDAATGQRITTLGATFVEGFVITLTDNSLPPLILEYEAAGRDVDRLAGATEGEAANQLQAAQHVIDNFNARENAALLLALQKLKGSRYTLTVRINDPALVSELSALDDAAIIERLKALGPDEFAARAATGAFALATDLDEADIEALVAALDSSAFAISVTRENVDHENSVTAVDWTDTALLSASADATIRVWDPAAGALLDTLAAHGDSIVALAWSPDGTRFASAGWDNVAIIWDASSGADAIEEALTLDGHGERITALAWSPDGSLLATGSRDATLRLWDTTTGDERAALDASAAELRAVAWSPDGTTLLTSAMDDTIRVWDAAQIVASAE